jgi:sigma-B regulation protein RsbU (phosphoserine phosphatase)
MTSLARHTLRVASLHEPTPSRVLAVLNSEVHLHGWPDLFCTAAYVHGVPAAAGGFDLTVALGGHPPGLVRRRDGSIEEAGRVGTLLGVGEPPALVDHRLHLAPGDMLVLYTDGVIEHREGARMFGEQRLHDLLAAMPTGASAEQVAAGLEQALADFTAGPPRDDVAIVILRAV